MHADDQRLRLLYLHQMLLCTQIRSIPCLQRKSAIELKSELWRLKALRENVKTKNYHVTFEPPFDDPGEVDLTGIDWIVVGTMTGAMKKTMLKRKA